MNSTLSFRVLSGYIILGLLSLLILCTFTQKSISEYMIQREAQRLHRQASRIASDYASRFITSSMSLKDFQMQMEISGSYLDASIWIIDNQGHLLFDSSDPTVGTLAANAEYTTLPDFDSTDFGNHYYITGNFYDSFSTQTLTVFSTITSGYKVKSYVLIHKPLTAINNTADNFMNISFYTVVIIYLCVLVLLLLLFLSLYRPIRKILQVAHSYASGDFKERTNIHQKGEIGFLANTLDYMADELATLEDDQRKFISNVSHDFRSPLTSIKGYVEAMQDGTIPPEMQEKYFNIILFETERLTKLTQSLIDLNRFGRHGIMLVIMDFDINRMIKTSILTFEGTCTKRGLSFDLVLTGEELFVTADESKIQQVLYNLIDNAIKFSHNDSAIKIETSVKNEKVFISVKDSGIGIPTDSLKKIWNRFYKTDLSRGKDKKGTGLGLSIVKEIIQAHNENINVISTEGVGTEFIFTLPLSKKEVQ